MTASLMTLEVLLPFETFLNQSDVSRIVVETRAGSFGLLPQRLDSVALVTPGIFIYETRRTGEIFLAVDEGVLVKTGARVLVSVHRALAGTDLRQLRELVSREFLAMDEQERIARAAMAKLETGFMRRFVRLQHG